MLNLVVMMFDPHFISVHVSLDRGELSWPVRVRWSALRSCQANPGLAYSMHQNGAAMLFPHWGGEDLTET